MTNINNQSQFLDNIAGLEDLDHENAAVCSGGKIILYDGANQTGVAISFPSRSIANLSDYGFNNKASSINISAGEIWELFTDENFGGASLVAPAGKRNLAAGFSNKISSIRRLV